MIGPWAITQRGDGSLYVHRGNPAPGSAAGYESFNWYGTMEQARAFCAAETLLKLHRAIVTLASGYDESGAIGPREPLRWETVARMAMDYARSAVAEVEAPLPSDDEIAELVCPHGRDADDDCLECDGINF